MALPEARLLDANFYADLLSFPPSADLVFVCDHGFRRQAETFCCLGFCSVKNLEVD